MAYGPGSASLDLGYADSFRSTLRSRPPAAEITARAGWAEQVVRQDQAGLFGLTRAQIRAQVDGSRWLRSRDHAVVLHNGPPTRRQLMWVALLDAGAPAALVAHTALELNGFRSFASERDLVHVVVPRGWRTSAFPWLRVHESRRVRPDEHLLVSGLPTTSVAQSAIDAAAWQPHPRFAWALVAAVVQQRLVTPQELDDELRHVGRVRHEAVLRMAVTDLRAGGTTTGEADVVRLCRRFGLQLPLRQVRRLDAAGRLRFTDAEWLSAGGDRVVLEVDGAHHLTVEHWQADMERERSVVLTGAQVRRTSNMELRLTPQQVAADLIRAGVRRVVGPCGGPGDHRG